ncbi:hypothetical protein BC827DRAFT_1241460 [Russula dissimulans]|nr:hypothetical protein BC827DRAFT_1241460 [Russula dissimulans]
MVLRQSVTLPTLAWREFSRHWHAPSSLFPDVMDSRRHSLTMHFATFAGSDVETFDPMVARWPPGRVRVLRPHCSNRASGCQHLGL